MKPKILTQYAPRKILHMVTGCILIAAVILGKNIFGLQNIITFGVYLLCIFVVIEIIRIEYKQRLPYQDVLKSKERSRFHALIYSLISGIIVFSIFDFWIAVAACLMATFGDPLASLVGKSIGKYKLPINKTKTYEGTIVNLIVCTIIALIVLWHLRGPGIAVGIWMAIVATTAEVFSGKTEDNFTIPLFSAALGQLLLWMF